MGTLPSHLVVGMPALSPTMELGNLTQWLKKEGDSVAPGDVIALIETDKATVDFEAQEDCVVAKHLVTEGAQGVKVGQPILITVDEASAVGAFKDYVIPDEDKPAAIEEPPQKQEKLAPAESDAPKDTVVTPPKPTAKKIDEKPKPEPSEQSDTEPQSKSEPTTKSESEEDTKQAKPAAKESPSSAKLSQLKWGHGITQSPLYSSIKKEQLAYVEKYGSTLQTIL